MLIRSREPGSSDVTSFLPVKKTVFTGKKSSLFLAVITGKKLVNLPVKIHFKLVFTSKKRKKQ